MNGYNILVIILACVVLGVSIWAFVTRCNTDKFGDNNTAYENFLNQPFPSIEFNGKLRKWGFTYGLGIDFFTFINTSSPFPENIYLPEGSINPFINCDEHNQCTIDPNFISKDNYKELINHTNLLPKTNTFLTRPTDYSINNPEWQNELKSKKKN